MGCLQFWNLVDGFVVKDWAQNCDICNLQYLYRLLRNDKWLRGTSVKIKYGYKAQLINFRAPEFLVVSYSNALNVYVYFIALRSS